ncbi:DUF5666 domain-containing protein [Shewanella violacea]|uniref:DUF5666 domain-containing protein n=1 Tax=Shewanella violacea TaxID=60217 RepID=UPI00031B1260|nr:DUF5666 domain-containing protein [Shewanella violacea]
MNNKNKFIPTIALASIFLTACGSDSSNESTANSQLNLTISGLPVNALAQVEVTGPNNYRTSLTATSTLKDLVPGTYEVSAAEVIVAGSPFRTASVSSSFSLVAGESAAKTLIYGAPQLSIGAISGFGSVYVNGVRYATDDTEFSHNGAADSSESLLSVGKIVKVQALVPVGGDAIAIGVSYSADVIGEIQSIDLAKGVIRVLGQSYFINELTQFENLTFDQLTVGQGIEISAIRDESGQYMASHVELTDSLVSWQILGVVTNLNLDTKVFNLGSLIVDYSGVELDGEFKNGSHVEVSSATGMEADSLVADAIEIQEMELPGARLALEGIVSELNGNEFTVDGRLFSLNSDTEFTQGKREDLHSGVAVSLLADIIEGASPVLEIRIELLNEMEIQGQVESLNAEGFTLAGIEFLVDEFTRYEDDSDLDIRKFSLADITVGDRLEIQAFENEAGLVCREIERENANEADIVELDGAVDAIESPTFSMKGLTVRTSALTQFEDASGNVIGQDEFFAALMVMDQVEVEGTVINGELVALDVEMESEDDNAVELSGKIDSLDSAQSFTVNGHKVITNGNTRFEDGIEANLSLDVVVEIEGSQADDGTILADKIEFSELDDHEIDLQGVIASLGEMNFDLGGLSISFDLDTEFEYGQASDLALGRYLIVEAQLQEDGSLLARDIEFDDEGQLEIEGSVDGFNSVTDFVVNGLKVTTTAATQFENGTQDSLANGKRIEVEGLLEGTSLLVAQVIEFQGPQERELEGSIEQFVSASEFTLAGEAIITDSFTQYDKGRASDLAAGVKVKIQGYLNESGVILAEELEFIHSQQLQVSGAIDSFVSTLEFSVDGQAVLTDETTEFTGDIKIALSAGLKVNVEGYLQEGNILLATIVSAVE